MKRLIVIALLISATAHAADKKAEALASPAMSPVPAPSVAPVKAEKKKSLKLAPTDVVLQDKIEKIIEGCDVNKKKCIFKLKEARSKVTNPKDLKHIDDILKTLK